MKKNLLSLLAIVAMTSCTQTEMIVPQTNGDNVEITLKSTALSVEGVTRAPFDGAIASTNPLDARIVATATTGNYNALYVDGVMKFQDQATETHFESGYTGKNYYPSDGTTLGVSGLYPAKNKAQTPAGWTFATDKATFNFTGCEDVMVAKEVQWNKSKAQASSSNIPNLAFVPLLTKLNIKLQAADANAIAAWGAISKIELVATKSADPFTSVSVDLVNGTATSGSFSTGTTPFKCYGMTETGGTKTYTDVAYESQSYSLTTTSTYQAYALIAPLQLTTVTTGDLKFKVYAANANGGAQDVIVELKDNLGADYDGFTQSKAFDINLKFKATEITATASVTDWTPMGNSDTEIQ